MVDSYKIKLKETTSIPTHVSLFTIRYWQLMFQILLIGFLQIKTNQGKIEKNIKSLNQTTSRA